MSRKANERRFNPDAFVEANLWAVTRGRPHKPRFRAERAVVVVAGGGAARRDTPVDPPRGVTPAPSRAAAHLAPPPSPSDAPGSGPTPTAALLDAMPVADATFARTACETVYVLDYSPLARDVPSELASSYPGRVAKPAARVLQKLNLADAVLAADGADAAILLKLLASLGGGDACRAAVIRRPHLMPPAALRAFAGGAAATDAPVDVRCAPGTAEDAATDLRSVLPSASFEEEEAAAAEGEDAASFAAAVASRVAAVEAEDAVAGAPDWLGEDAPTYVARVAFVHDRASKQVAQLVEDVTERARESARRREATTTEKGGEGSRGGGSGDSAAAAAATSAVAAAATSAAAAAEDSSDDAKTSKRDEADAPPMVYEARRPFHPWRLARTLRAYFPRLAVSEDEGSGRDSEDVSGSGSGCSGSAPSAATRAARLAADAADAASESARAAHLGVLASGADAAARAAASASAAAADAAAKSAAAALAAARLLDRLVLDSRSSAERKNPNPTGPFAGVRRSTGVVWLANRPGAPAFWTHDASSDGSSDGAVTVVCPTDARWDAAAAADLRDGAGAAPGERDGFAGDRRQELAIEGSGVDAAALRDALDACLLDEAESAAWFTTSRAGAEGGQGEGEGEGEGEEDAGGSEATGGSGPSRSVASSSGVAALGVCFAPWPERVEHLAALGVRLGGRGSYVLACASVDAARKRASGGGGYGGSGGGGGFLSGADEVQAAGEGVAGLPRATAAPSSSSRGLGGKVGVRRAEAFRGPGADGRETRAFPEGTGHFWARMPCLECGSPWWLGEDWDAACANCGGDAESYDDDGQPVNAAYRRRFKKFRELVDALEPL